MKIILLLVFQLTAIFLGLVGQTDNRNELQKYNSNSLFNSSDQTCSQIAGEWTGEEIQYDPTKSFIKVKYKVVFRLQQQGNKVYGTSYIEDKYRKSYGDMKIRGIVSGNKFLFEEYQIVDEKFYQPGWVWCYRSGEMIISHEGQTINLTGADYKGYGSDNYQECTDYCEMFVTHHAATVSEPEVAPIIPKEEIVLHSSVETNNFLVYPNPFNLSTTLSYELKESATVRIDVFSLSGQKIKVLFEDHQTAGIHKFNFDLGEANPGIYIVRFCTENAYYTKQVVKTQ